MFFRIDISSMKIFSYGKIVKHDIFVSKIIFCIADCIIWESHPKIFDSQRIDYPFVEQRPLCMYKSNNRFFFSLIFKQISLCFHTNFYLSLNKSENFFLTHKLRKAKKNLASATKTNKIGDIKTALGQQQKNKPSDCCYENENNKRVLHFSRCICHT